MSDEVLLRNLERDLLSLLWPASSKDKQLREKSNDPETESSEVEDQTPPYRCSRPFYK